MIRPETQLHRSPDLRLWLIWLLATAGSSVGWVLLIYLGLLPDLDGLLGIIDDELFVGLPIGIVQSLVLRRHLYTKAWWFWGLLSWFGWVLALMFLAFGWFFSHVPMMNPEAPDFEQNATLQCVWAFACGIAGVSLGSIQSLYFVRFLPSVAWTWIGINAIAWIIGGFVGRIVSILLHQLAMGSTSAAYDSPARGLSMIVGIVVALTIMGAITGVGVVLSLRSIAETRLPTQTQEGVNAK